MLKSTPVLLLLCLFSSCNMLLGIKKPKPVSDEKARKMVSAWHKEDQDVIRINTNAFFSHFDSLYHHEEGLFKDLAQPMQIIVYDKNKNNIAHFINCNIGGLPLKWNRFHSFDKFPLQTNGFLEPAYKLQFEEINAFLQPQFKVEEIEKMFEENDYVYIIYYNQFLKRLTQSMHRNIKRHRTKFKDQKVKYIYVLIDDLYIKMENEQKNSHLSLSQ